MQKLITWLENKINQPLNHHNTSVYMWSKGYRKALVEVLEFMRHRGV